MTENRHVSSKGTKPDDSPPEPSATSSAPPAPFEYPVEDCRFGEDYLKARAPDSSPSASPSSSSEPEPPTPSSESAS